MEAQKARQAWEQFLQFIREKVPQDQTFSTWFEPLEFVEFAETDGERKLVISGPNRFVGEFIEEHYARLVANAVRSAYGMGVKVEYRFAPDAPAPSPQPILSGSAHVAPPALAQSGGEAGGTQSGFDPNLNPDYTFANFIEGKSNKLARSVGLSIADNPKQVTFNPFFIYGPSGVGKTHLATAIGWRIVNRFPQKRVLMVSAHTFMRQFTDSVRRDRWNDFINFYQSVDVLIVDDIQEMTTPRTQQTFFHIFNHLHLNKRLLIMTSDRPPALLEGMEERLLTRFKWGMSASLHRPDATLRRRILESKIKSNGLTIADDVVSYIAENVSNNVRELEGVINSLMLRSIVNDREIDVPMAAHVISCLVNLEKRQISVQAVTKAVCRHYKVKERDVASAGRKKEVVQARHLAMFLSQKYTGLSSAQIGRNFGKRDHSTVLYACSQVEKRISIDMAYRQEVEEIESTLNT